MRIVESSSSRLELRENLGSLTAVLVAAAVFLALFVVAKHQDPRQLITAILFAVSAVFFRRDSRVTFDKLAGRCDISRLDMWRRSRRTIPFEDIRDVQVEVERPDAGAVAHSRLTLETSTGAIPLTAGYSATLDWHIKLRELILDVIFASSPVRRRLMPPSCSQTQADRFWLRSGLAICKRPDLSTRMTR